MVYIILLNKLSLCLKYPADPDGKIVIYLIFSIFKCFNKKMKIKLCNFVK